MASEITLNLPTPISVNATRRIDWRNHARTKEWLRQADALFLTQKRGLPPPITGPFEIAITLQNGSQIDADNALKLLIDFVRRVRLVTDDSPRFMKRITVEFGDVEGCRVVIRPFSA